MANINFTITGITQGSNWSGVINAQSLGSVTGTKPISISPTGGTSFDMLSGAFNYPVNYNGGGANGSYFTIREQYITVLYPTQGSSIDIWSEDLTTAIADGETWQNLIDAGPYDLSTGKFSLIYDYFHKFAPFWSKGGTIDFT